MEENIYRDMIEDSPMAYIHFKIIKDESGNYKDIEVKDYNKTYQRIFLKNSKIKVSDVNFIPKDEKEFLKWKKAFDYARINKKFTYKGYLEALNKSFCIEIFKGKEEDEFHVRMIKISDQNIQLSSILRKSPFMSWIKDKDGRYIDVNERYLIHFNKSYEDVIGKTDYDLWSEDVSKAFDDKDNIVIENNKLYTYEEIYNIAGDDRYYETMKWPYMDEYNTMILGTVGISFDKTDDIKLRQKLEENEKRFLEIANNIKEVIIIRDDKKAQYINPAFEKVCGFSPDSLYEEINSWHEYWNEVEVEEGSYEYSENKTSICTFKVIKEGQDDKWIWSRFVPILDENGNIVKQIGILSDITESKKIQLELDKLKLDFFANLSHELRTPINLILSSLQVLGLKMDDLEPETFDYFNKYLSIVAQNGKRLLKLVNNLIDTTRLDSGCFDYNPKNKDIVCCVENICTSISEFIKNNNMNMIFDTNVEEKIIAFDQDNMERIILNLISNAIKFNKPNGEIFINIECDESIKISIKDTGIGIPKEKLETIFGRFDQVKTKFKKEREGSGIGLSLVKSLVEMHDGTICVKSDLGEGSEFIITLPDILIKDEEKEDLDTSFYLSNVNRMDVEFSDIYV